jgi:hypothetical protein
LQERKVRYGATAFTQEMICVSMVRSQELKVYKIAVQVPTYNDDMPEGCRIVDAGAVPSLMSKLVLALGGS